MSVHIIGWRQINKNGLAGLVSVELKIGLTIIDYPVFTGEHGPWVALPSRPSLDRDGQQRVVDGRKQYEPVLSWPSRDVADAFSAAVLAQIRERHPGALP